MPHVSRRNSRNAPATAGPLDPVAMVAQFLGKVREARGILSNPTADNLDECRRKLDVVAAEFQQSQALFPNVDLSGRTVLAAELGKLRAEIMRIAILLDGASGFYRGWIRLVGSMASGYTASGTPAPLETRGQVLLEI